MVTILKKLFVICISFFFGLVAGTMIATPNIAIMNYLATDGPIFPAPLVAFGFLALPIGIVILIFQILLVIYEMITKRELSMSLIYLALISGLLAGTIWFLVLQTSYSTFLQLIALTSFGVFQALCVFACHWLAIKFLLWTGMVTEPM